jgi:DNA processing protein
MDEGTRTVLALSQLPRIGGGRLREILARAVRPDAGESWPTVLERLNVLEFSAAEVAAALTSADDLLQRCRSLGVNVHAFGSTGYPKQLMRLTDPPALLFSMGQFDSTHSPRIAVIGTREPTKWGVNTAQACAARIAELGGVVVSGLALGIDTAAHHASLDRRGVTWAVLAHGLDTISPLSNRALAHKIIESGGTLMSEYPPGTAPLSRYFVERDRIQAGLADAVLLIESDLAGGAMHTVRFAEQVGVPVWVTFPEAEVQSSDRSQLAAPQQGPWELLRTKAATLVPTLGMLETMVHGLLHAHVNITKAG